MKREEAIKKATQLTAEIENKNYKPCGAPNFTEYRKELAPECQTPEFNEFAVVLEQTGLEIRNIFSIYSKIKLVSPEFIELYKSVGPIIKRPTTGCWNLKSLVKSHYNVPHIEAVYRIIEQEKIPDSYGTARSGFEALQVIFVKGTVLGHKTDKGDYTNDGIVYENKGESGRLIGQERLFSERHKKILFQLSEKYHTTSWSSALRRAAHDPLVLTEWLIDIFEGVYEDVTLAIHAELAQIYSDLIKTIPESYEVINYKPYCIKRATKWLEAQWGIKEVKSQKAVPSEIREKECLNFVMGIFELYIYQKYSGFDVLDLCETYTGRILSFSTKNKSLTELAKELYGKVRFYGTIAGGTRDGAHQIGFKY